MSTLKCTFYSRTIGPSPEWGEGDRSPSKSATDCCISEAGDRRALWPLAAALSFAGHHRLYYIIVDRPSVCRDGGRSAVTCPAGETRRHTQLDTSNMNMINARVFRRPPPPPSSSGTTRSPSSHFNRSSRRRRVGSRGSARRLTATRRTNIAAPRSITLPRRPTDRPGAERGPRSARRPAGGGRAAEATDVFAAGAGGAAIWK